jgi:uncharacterized protein DUF6159
MFDSLQRSWDLLTESISVLARDKRLLLFPVLSAIATVLVTLTFLMPLYASGALENLALKDSLRHGDSATYFLLFLFYYVNYFVTVFFNSALVAAAGLFLEGVPATVNDGLRVAGNRLGRIAYWTLIASTVGWLLRAVQGRAGRAGSLISGLFGIAWSLITYFIVPVIVFEDRPVFDSIDRSVTLFREAWGEEATSGVGFSLIWLLASIPAFLLVCATFRSHFMVGIGLAFFYFLFLATVGSAAKGVFTVALYRYAAHAEAPSWFSGNLIQSAFASHSGGISFGPAPDKTNPAIEALLLNVELIPSETRDTYLIRAQAGQTVYHASYRLEAVDPGFQPDSWQPGTPLKLRIYGDWLLISGPGCPQLWCHFFKVAAPHN